MIDVMALSRETLARRIRDALARSGTTQLELAGAIGIDPTALSKALAGRRAFKSLEVALIAEQLGVSTDVLLADDHADTQRQAIAARTRHRTRPVVDLAIARADDVRRVDILLSDLGHPGHHAPALPRLPERPDVTRQGEALADAVRRRSGLGDDDLPAGLDDFAAWVEERLGVDVCITPLPAGLDGLALSSGGLHLALVSSGVAATRQRFTIAHEICHLAAGDAQELRVDEDVADRRTAEELRANAFAAAFLMPARTLRAACRGTFVDEDLVADLLGRLRVSLDALAFRLRDLGLVDAEGRDRVRAMSSVRIALRPGRVGDLQARNEHRAPSRLVRRAVEAYAAGDIGIAPLATLLDVDPDRLLEELSPARFPELADLSDESVYAL